MEISISPEKLYLGLILILTILQIWQQIQISFLKKETKILWEQITNMIVVGALRMNSIEENIDKINKKSTESQPEVENQA